MTGRQRGLRHALHQPLGPHPVLDQVRDRDDQQTVLLRELRQLRHARHRAVLVHDFADHAGRIETGHARQIDRRLGLTGANQHAAVAGAQRRHVTGPREVARPSSPDRSPRARCGAIGRGDAGRDVRRASIGTQNAVPNGVELSVTASGISSSSSRWPVIDRQISPRPVLRHEVDRLGRHLRRRHRQIAFVLAILIVTTMIIRPARIAAMASSIDANGPRLRALWRCGSSWSSSCRCPPEGGTP